MPEHRAGVRAIWPYWPKWASQLEMGWWLHVLRLSPASHSVVDVPAWNYLVSEKAEVSWGMNGRRSWMACVYVCVVMHLLLPKCSEQQAEQRWVLHLPMSIWLQIGAFWMRTGWFPQERLMHWFRGWRVASLWYLSLDTNQSSYTAAQYFICSTTPE